MLDTQSYCVPTVICTVASAALDPPEPVSLTVSHVWPVATAVTVSVPPVMLAVAIVPLGAVSIAHVRPVMTLLFGPAFRRRMSPSCRPVG